MRKGAIAATIVVTLAFFASSGLGGASLKFTSCDQMHLVYKYGVATNKASQSRAVREGAHRPALKPLVYSASNKTLDRDKDGVMCEVPR